MKDILLVITCFVVLPVAGCTSMFTAKTCATAKTSAGDLYEYCSDKEYQGIDAKAEFYPDGKFKSIAAKVGKSGTPEASTQAALELSLENTKFLRELIGSMSKSGGK